MFKNNKMRFLMLALVMTIGLSIIAAKPIHMSQVNSLWVGAISDTANVTPGDNDLFVGGNIILNGGISTTSTVNTTATAITLTSADSGNLFYENTSGLTTGGVPIVYTLPADPTGLTFSFALGTSSNQVAVNPAAGDRIVTGGKDYYYWADTAGSALVIKGINSSTWVVVGATAPSAASWQFADDS